MLGFWYLSAGIVMKKKSRWFYPIGLVNLFVSFLTSGGIRSLLAVSLLFPVLLFLFSSKELPRLQIILLFGLLSVGILLGLDILRNGRQGLVSEGSLQGRIARTLRADFAFGCLGLKLGLDNLSISPNQGINSLERLVTLPIPRVLWPDKPTANPSQEYTERATGLSYADFNSILLFTPLGEALFNFGYLGIIIIPVFYGFVTRFLERFYSASKVFSGLLAHVIYLGFFINEIDFFQPLLDYDRGKLCSNLHTFNDWALDSNSSLTFA